MLTAFSFSLMKRANTNTCNKKCFLSLMLFVLHFKWREKNGLEIDVFSSLFLTRKEEHKYVCTWSASRQHYGKCTVQTFERKLSWRRGKLHFGEITSLERCIAEVNTTTATTRAKKKSNEKCFVHRKMRVKFPFFFRFHFAHAHFGPKWNCVTWFDAFSYSALHLDVTNTKENDLCRETSLSDL